MPNEMDLEITLPGSEEESSEDAEETQDGEESESEGEGEDTEEESESEDESESEESDPDGEKKEDEDKEDEEDDKKKTEGKLRHGRPSYRDIKEKFPEFFKTFPDLRDAFFREREYSKVFPTLDDAKEALAYARSFGEVSQSLMQGDPGLLFGQLHEANPEAFRNVAQNLLPTLHKIDKEAFFEVTTPLIERFVKSMDEEGIKSNNVNLRKAALIVGHFMTGEFKIPDSSTGRERVNPEREKLNQERNQFHQHRFQTAQSDVFKDGGEALNSEIEKVLVDEDGLTDWQRQKLSEEILKKVNTTLTQDERHMALMNSLWKKWEKSNFSADAKKAIVNAYLSRAKQVIIPVRDRVMKDAMKRKPVKKFNKSSESQNRSSESASMGATDAKKVDWTRTSDKDFLNDKVTLRK